VGTAGIIRNRKDRTELALLHGTHIAAAGISLATNDTDLGISATVSNDGSIRGFYFAPSASSVEIGLNPRSEKLLFYIDGGEVSGNRSTNRLALELPPGKHQWELALGLPIPLAPRIERTEYTKGGVIVYGASVSSASTYRLEVSADDAQTWTESHTASDPTFTLTGLTLNRKYHVRLRARNASGESAPGSEYPVYVTQEPPPAPDGLHVALSTGEAEISWGEVLGVTEYRLYRKTSGMSEFSVAYAGRLTRWTEEDTSIESPAESRSGSTGASMSSAPAIEYYVTSFNQIGESLATQGERFRRTVELSEGNLPNDSGSRYYPR
jgi:hypothetical protein